jgi:hypothetical protein
MEKPILHAHSTLKKKLGLKLEFIYSIDPVLAKLEDAEHATMQVQNLFRI